MNALKFYIVIFFLVLMTTACEKKKNILQELPKDKTLLFYSQTEPPTLDWNKASDTTSNMLLTNIMDGLVDYDFSKQSISYKPALAQKIQSINNGQIWVFTMREGVYWSDGVSFKAQHVVDGWERALNPQTASPYAYFLYHVKNAEEYNRGEVKDFSKVGVSVTKDGKLRVELTGPKYFFPLTLTHSTTYPIRKDVIKNHGVKWTEPENIVTLGPYFLHTWKHDKLIILKKNSSYYGSFAGNVENVSIRIIPELSTTLNLFETKKLDILYTLPSKMVSVLNKRPDYYSFATPTIYYYGLNMRAFPTNNKKFRQALNMAIDRREFEKLFPSIHPLSTWVPQSIFGYNSSLGLPFNPQKARRLLKEVAKNKPLPKLSIFFNTSEDHKRIAENIQAQLKKNLSLKVEVRNEEWKTYLSRLQNLDNESHKQERNIVYIYRMGWVPDYPDPMTYMSLLTSRSDNNYTGWTNNEYDRLVSEASVLRNSSKRKRLLDRAQEIIAEEAPIIPFWQGAKHFLVSPRIKKYPYNTMEKYIFKEVVLQ